LQFGDGRRVHRLEHWFAALATRDNADNGFDYGVVKVTRLPLEHGRQCLPVRRLFPREKAAEARIPKTPRIKPGQGFRPVDLPRAGGLRVRQRHAAVPCVWTATESALTTVHFAP
jgi:hypothetical protein